MNAELPCPGRDQLERLLLGAMPAEEMEVLQGHLTQCPACLQMIREVTTEDAFILAVRAGGRAERMMPPDADPTLLARLRRLRPTGKSTASMAVGTLASEPIRAEELSRLLMPPEEPDELGRFGAYGILRSLGSGGMGVVFAARQAQPRRIIALKMILAAARDGQRLARFRSETEIIARLQHPNIVPVYEVGEQEGWPYYTMEYVDGGSLAQRLAAAPLAPRPAAEMALLLARAIHFAHERGIIHRDLKPANVLLADDGAPRIADFGLAKQLDGALAEPSPYRTESGALVGTPGYMAPEQIESKREVGPTADVYALGAILYECLTGRPPFRAATVLETLEQVRHQEPAAISRLQPNVPRDLQTICLKCLHKEPGRRYYTAAALADDLNRFLRGEPIRARPVSVRERVWKWSRRNPALAALLTVTGLSLLALTVSILVYNARLRTAIRRAEDKEAETHRQYRQAHDTLDRMLGRLEDRQMAEVPKLKELQRSLLGDALAFYQGILQQSDSPDPAVRKDAAVTRKRAADIQFILGQLDGAGENYRRAIELIESLPAEQRDSQENRMLQAGIYQNWSTTAGAVGRMEEAVRLNEKALELFERLVHERPDDPYLQNELAKVEHTRGVFFRDKNLKEAESHYLKAVALRTALIRDHPEQESYRADLAADYHDLGGLYNLTNRGAEGAAIIAKAETLLRPLVERHPAERSYALTLVAVSVTRGYYLANAGQSREALERLDTAVRLAEDALRREPKDRTAHNRALIGHGARAEVLDSLERFADSVKDWDRVIELERGPNRLRWRLGRASALAKAGDHARAATEADALAALPETSNDNLFVVARVYSLAMKPARGDKRLPPSERERLAERYAVKAIALLRKLNDKGYFKDTGHAKLLTSEEDLQPLRAREDFRGLLAAGGKK